MPDKKKILLVEDDKNITEIYTDELKEKGYEVISTDDGSKVFKLLEEELPDIIIMDIKLPEIEGTEILKNIREKNIDTPIIICTSYSFSDKHKTLYETLANSILIKPVDLDILTDKLEQILQTRKESSL